MKQAGASNFDSISKAFSRLSTKKQENVLETARDLLRIQDKGTCPIKQKRKVENKNH
jgi:hypothetical protein